MDLSEMIVLRKTKWEHVILQDDITDEVTPGKVQFVRLTNPEFINAIIASKATWPDFSWTIISRSFKESVDICNKNIKLYSVIVTTDYKTGKKNGVELVFQMQENLKPYNKNIRLMVEMEPSHSERS